MALWVYLYVEEVREEEEAAVEEQEEEEEEKEEVEKKDQKEVPDYKWINFKQGQQTKVACAQLIQILPKVK